MQQEELLFLYKKIRLHTTTAALMEAKARCEALRAARVVLLLLLVISIVLKDAASLTPSKKTHTHAHTRSLFPYQKFGTNELIEKKRILLADEMGLGKTVQCIEALNKICQHGSRNQDTPDTPDMPDSGDDGITVTVTALVICPKSLLGVWESELRTWVNPSLPLDIQIVTATKSKKRAPFPVPESEESKRSEGSGSGLGSSSSSISVTLINYDVCHKFRDKLRERTYDVLICDEAHYLKSPKAKRTEAVFGDFYADADADSEDIRSTTNTTNMHGRGRGIQAEFMWLLTGTPVLNRPVELFTLLRAIQPHEFSSFTAYTERYCDPKTIVDRRGNYRMDYTGATNLLELSKRLEPIMLRRYKADVLTQLPSKFRGVTVLQSSTSGSGSERDRLQEILIEREGEREQHDIVVGPSILGEERYASRYGYGSEVESFGSEATGLAKYLGVSDKDMSDPDERNRIFGYIASVRKETALMKVEVAADLLEDMIESDKIVVFAHHREVIHQLTQRFGKRAVCVMGGTSADDRTKAVRRFQEDDDVRMFVGSIRAAGVGLTLTASSNVVFLEMDWSPGVMSQAEDRCHRVGQINSVRVQYFVFRDTIDEWVAKSLMKKQINIDQILPVTKLAEKELADDSRSVTSGYTFDFGKYEGLRLEDTPDDYIQFLVEKEVWKQRPGLLQALQTKGLLHDAPTHTFTSDMNDILNVEPLPIGGDTSFTRVVETKDIPYRFDFGKYKGELWHEVPKTYQAWIVREGVWKKRPLLKTALLNAELIDTVEHNTIESVKEDSDEVGSSTKQCFPIKSFRLNAQCTYIILELMARGISFEEDEKGKITKLKKRLLNWHKGEYPDASTREIELIGCKAEELWSVTTVAKQ